MNVHMGFYIGKILVKRGKVVTLLIMINGSFFIKEINRKK